MGHAELLSPALSATPCKGNPTESPDRSNDDAITNERKLNGSIEYEGLETLRHAQKACP